MLVVFKKNRFCAHFWGINALEVLNKHCLFCKLEGTLVYKEIQSRILIDDGSNVWENAANRVNL